MHEYISTNNKPVHIFNFKSPLLYIWWIYVVIFLNRCLFLQVDNLNVATNLENYFFYVMLTHVNAHHFAKN